MKFSQRDVREELRNLTKGYPQPLDRLCQRLITWITGKPHLKQKPLLVHTPTTYLLLALVELSGGALASFLILESPPQFWLLLWPSWLTTLGGARIIEATVNHQCAHGNFSGSKKSDRFLLEILSTILLIQPYDGYVRDHVGSVENKNQGHHNIRVLGTKADPAFQFVLRQGFCPGQEKAFYWELLFRTMISPDFHWSLVKDRLQSNLVTCPTYRKLMTIAWIACFLGLVAYTNTWLLFSIALLFPLTILHNISALLFALTEHIWGIENES
jgi:fatty acid desaturase